MAFQKTQWYNGRSPAITAEQLNRIENGIYDNEQAIENLNQKVDDLGINADVQKAIDDETTRAKDAEANITKNLTQLIEAETGRAQQAENDINNAYRQAVSNLSDATAQTFDSVSQQIQNILTNLSDKVDGGYVEDGYLYLTAEGEIVVGPLGPFSGGGGGGTNDAKLTVTNTSGWLSKTVVEGAECVISIKWSSTLDDVPDGPGTLNVLLGNTVKATMNIEQGDISIDVSPYLATGTNSVKIRVTDTYGNTRTINYTVEVATFAISSSFDASAPVTGAFSFPYIPTGVADKTVYFIVDNTVVGTQTVTTSGRQQSFTIPEQEHGDHSLLVYFTVVINEETVKSNELYYDIIALEDGETDIVIASDFRRSIAEQYTSLAINYNVYNPAALTTEIQLLANDSVISTQTVDRTTQLWTYRPDEVGSLKLQIKAGDTVKTFNLAVTTSSIDVHAETEDLALYLSSYGRSNNEANPDTWTYNDIETTFSGFNHVSDGWLPDADNITALSVSGDAQVTIGYKPFAQDFRSTGKTIGLEFATTDVLNYDAVIISCMSGGRGFEVTPQAVTIKSEQTSMSMQYKENEHNSIYFVVEKRSENRLMYCYINGIISGVIQYPDNDDFSQAEPVNITIGSSACTTNVYTIRIYDNDLTRYQVLDNWIADTQVIDMMLERYNRNNVYDEYGSVVIEKLPADLGYIIIEGSELPQYKGDKKTVNITYVDTVNPEKSFTAYNVQLDVQGTSSQYYARKNYKAKYRNGFVNSDGLTVDDYSMRDNSIPTNTFTYKKDVASSEGANNVELARLYNDICPYKTPAQVSDVRVRQGIDGFPIVIFYNGGSDASFVGKYNFNNDKGTPEVFGFENPDESIEIKNNTSNRVIWKSDDYSGTDYLNDFEWRYPDTDLAYTDATQLKEFATWVKSTDPDQATNESLPSPVTYGTGDDAVTYTTDSEEYRLAKFKHEAGNYMEMQSAIFYYLFTELFLMVDSRAKNAFPSFIGTEIS